MLHAVGVASGLICLLVYNVHVLVNEQLGGGVNLTTSIQACILFFQCSVFLQMKILP